MQFYKLYLYPEGENILRVLQFELFSLSNGQILRIYKTMRILAESKKSKRFSEDRKHIFHIHKLLLVNYCKPSHIVLKSTIT